VPKQTPAAERIVVMGRIVAPHGVRGWIKVEPVSEAPDALLAHEIWRVRPARATAWREIRMTSGRMHSGALLAELAGVATRDEALALRGAEVGVPRSALPRTRKHEIYWVDLEGLEVRNREGALLGTVAEVVTHGAHPLLRVVRAGGSPGPDRLIPYVPAIVDRVNIEEKRIDVDWGEGY
jgi:16S rRNA processing protein RimM